MTETARRLAPTQDTLRQIFLKSGNLCAFPGCGRLMMDAQGIFVGQVCHIEAAEEGGERFNPNMTNEARRAAANLMLMCYEHHTITNDVGTYTVEVLRRYKSDHENRFSRPDRAILESLTDWTRLDEPSNVANLNNMSRVLQWRENGLREHEHAERVSILNAHIEKLKVVPVDVRRFLGAVSLRMIRAQDTHVVETWGFSDETILATDLRGALRLNDAAIFQKANELEAYRLGSMDEMFVADVRQPAVRIYRLSGWPFWLELAEFCDKAPERIEVFTEDLDFQRLDGERPN